MKNVPEVTLLAVNPLSNLRSNLDSQLQDLQRQKRTTVNQLKSLEVQLDQLNSGIAILESSIDACTTEGDAINERQNIESSNATL